MCIGNKWVKTKTSLTFAVITVKFKLLVYALDFYPFWNVMTIFLMLSDVMNGQWCCSVNLSKPDYQKHGGIIEKETKPFFLFEISNYFIWHFVGNKGKKCSFFGKFDVSCNIRFEIFFFYVRDLQMI